MNRVLSLTVLALVFGAKPAFAGDLPKEEEYKLRGEYLEWRPKLSSQVGATISGITGNFVDLEDDLGVTDERTYQIRAALQVAPGHKLRFSYTPVDYSGDVRVGRTVTILGQTFDFSTQVVSSLKGKLYFGAYEFDIVKTRAGYFGLLLGAQYFDGGAAVAAPEFNVREAVSPTVPIPVFGATARGYVGKLSFEGEFSGLTIGERGHAYELNLGARFHVLQKLAATGGYRLVKVQGHDNTDFLSLKMGGFTFGLELSL